MRTLVIYIEVETTCRRLDRGYKTNQLSWCCENKLSGLCIQCTIDIQLALHRHVPSNPTTMKEGSSQNVLWLVQLEGPHPASNSWPLSANLHAASILSDRQPHPASPSLGQRYPLWMSQFPQWLKFHRPLVNLLIKSFLPFFVLSLLRNPCLLFRTM